MKEHMFIEENMELTSKQKKNITNNLKPQHLERKPLLTFWCVFFLSYIVHAYNFNKMFKLRMIFQSVFN